MIHPFNTQQIIAIIYAIGIVLTTLYNMYVFEDFQPIYLVYGCIWPLVLWFKVLILIFSYHVDLRSTKKIKHKPSYFDTFEGKQAHPDLKHRVRRYRETTIKRTK
jgi:hypothetical protein